MRKMGSIAVDFDGVIHKYSKGWQNGDIYDPPIEGIAAAMQQFLDWGYEVLIFSTRNYDRVVGGKGQAHQVEEIKAYLKAHRIPYTSVYTGPGKPLCKMWIDDRAYRFAGTWTEDKLSEIKTLLEE